MFGLIAVRDALQDITGSVRVVCRIRGRLESDGVGIGVGGGSSSSGGGSRRPGLVIDSVAARFGHDVGEVFALIGSNDDDSKQGRQPINQ